MKIREIRATEKDKNKVQCPETKENISPHSNCVYCDYLFVIGNGYVKCTFEGDEQLELF